MTNEVIESSGKRSHFISFSHAITHACLVANSVVNACIEQQFGELAPPERRGNVQGGVAVLKVNVHEYALCEENYEYESSVMRAD